MASERQVAANRRNARNSTGPRSDGGKKRASRSSYRHGLTAMRASNPKIAKAVERLARQIASDKTNAITLAAARAAARAQYDLVQIWQTRVALVERIFQFGGFGDPIISIRHIRKEFARTGRIPEPLEAVVLPMPASAPERSAEAIRRALPELLKLDRYERRATAQRNRNIRNTRGRKKVVIDPDGVLSPRFKSLKCYNA